MQHLKQPANSSQCLSSNWVSLHLPTPEVGNLAAGFIRTGGHCTNRDTLPIHSPSCAIPAPEMPSSSAIFMSPSHSSAVSSPLPSNSLPVTIAGSNCFLNSFTFLLSTSHGDAFQHLLLHCLKFPLGWVFFSHHPSSLFHDAVTTPIHSFSPCTQVFTLS